MTGTPVQDHAVAGPGEPATGGEDLLDVAEPAADDGRKKVDVDAAGRGRAPTSRPGRA